MNVREQLALLFQLAQKDWQLKDLKDKQKLVPLKANQAKLVTDEELKKEAFIKTQIKDLELKRHQLDLEIQTEKSNLRKWEARADKIKGEREYMTLMSEIGSLKKMIADSEARAFTQLEEQEKQKQALEKVQKKLMESQQLYEKEWADVSQEVSQLNQQVEDVFTLRQKILSSLTPTLQKRYEQIAAKRVGMGVAVLVKQICQACSRSLPPELCNRIAKGEVIETCPSCQRLLVSENHGVAG